jgi:hypothetical protein
VAPDLPGFGFTTAPERGAFAYTFDHLDKMMTRESTKWQCVHGVAGLPLIIATARDETERRVIR